MRSRNQFLYAAAMAALVTVGTLAQLGSDLDVGRLRAVVVQHDGRWMPIDTLARDVVLAVTGQEEFGGADSLATFLSWWLNPPAAMQKRLIPVPNAEVRSRTGLSPEQSLFSFMELIEHPVLRPMMDAVASVDEKRMDPLQQKVNEIRTKLVTLQGVFGGEGVRIIPDAKDPRGVWHALPAPNVAPPKDLADVVEAWNDLRRAVAADDSGAFDRAARQFAAALDAVPHALRPDSALIATEVRLNAVRPFRQAWRVMAVGAAVAIFALAGRRRWATVGAAALLVCGVVILSWGLVQRWSIADRIPAANMFESTLFLGWGMGVAAIVTLMLLRNRIVPLTASALAAAALYLSDVLPMDRFIRPVAPVLLDTVWMSIHVPIMMVSYAVLALAMLVAHVQIAVIGFAPRRTALAATVEGLHYYYLHLGSVLLAIGIMTGSMWASSSWGRCWGWDPKEVWSLTAFIGYMVILHVRAEPSRMASWAMVLGVATAAAMGSLVLSAFSGLGFGGCVTLACGLIAVGVLVTLRGTFSVAVKSIICFWLIIMTYLGVNYVLGTGLHSYGFGTGAVVRHMAMTGVADLAIIAVCSAAFLAHRRRDPHFGGAAVVPADA